MDEENETKEEDQPTSSKNLQPAEELSDNTRQDQRDQRDQRDPRDQRDQRDPRDQRDQRDQRDPRDQRDQRVTSSASSSTGSYLSRSSMVVAEAPRNATRAVGINKRGRGPKTHLRKRKLARRPGRSGRPGRVEKRSRSYSRRHVRKFSRRKPRMREIKSSQPSVSTVFTRYSRSPCRITLCSNCGHRCCRRRAEMIQVGSRSAMLSPLFMNTMTEPAANEVEGISLPFTEVSPQIIYESLRRFSVWRQYVMTGDLMDYIRRTYPVNQVEAELYDELKEKLRVASIAGFVIEPFEDNWCLASAMKDRQLSPNHVTLFWEAYIDTMCPLRKTPIFRVKEEESSELAVKSKKDIL